MPPGLTIAPGPTGRAPNCGAALANASGSWRPPCGSLGRRSALTNTTIAAPKRTAASTSSAVPMRNLSDDRTAVVDGAVQVSGFCRLGTSDGDLGGTGYVTRV